MGVVLALGQWFDLEKPRTSVGTRAAELFRLSVYALNSRSIIDGGLKIMSMQGVQPSYLKKNGGRIWVFER